MSADATVIPVQPGRYRTEIRLIPYANGGADIRLVQVGPRGGVTTLWYVGGEGGAEDTRRKIRQRHRNELRFLRTVAEFYPEDTT